MSYKVVKYLVSSGPNPDSRWICVESEHDDEAAAIAAANELQFAAYEKTLADGSENNAYQFQFEVE